MVVWSDEILVVLVVGWCGKNSVIGGGDVNYCIILLINYYL
jgi:hypothetical protein